MSGVGSWFVQSPELLRGEEYDERSDVVSALEAKLEAYAAAMRTTVWAASATSAAVAAWASLGEGAYVTPWENVSGYSYGYE